MDLLQSVDTIATGPVLITGSLPPLGRDLDLLMDRSQKRSLSRRLDEMGFFKRGHTWVRFTGCDVDAIELFTSNDWGLPSAEAAALIAESHSFLAFKHVRLPAPHHLMLILALRTRWGGRFETRHRDRMRDALRRNPEAWERAAEHARAWGVPSELKDLKDRFERAAPSGDLDGSVPLPREKLPAMVTTGFWPRLRGARTSGSAVIAFSGLDGSGKTTQAEALKNCLIKLGFDAVIVWTRIEWTTLIESRLLQVVAWPVKMVLRMAARSSTRKGHRPARTQLDVQSRVDPARQLRQRSDLLTSLWTLVVATNHALSQRRAVRQELRKGCVVICDRYTLDAGVQLRNIYGRDRHFRTATSLMHRISPRPARAYFIDVPAAEAIARKPDAFTEEELELQSELYGDLYTSLGVTRLSGVLARDQLCELIARDVWMTLD